MTVFFHHQSRPAVVYIRGRIAFHCNNLLTILMVRCFDAARKGAELFFQRVPSMNIHRELIAHIDHDMNIFGEINHLRRHIALQIGKTINNNGEFAWLDFDSDAVIPCGVYTHKNDKRKSLHAFIELFAALLP